MTEEIEFELVSPESLLVSKRASMVVVPGSEGDFGVLPRHSPLISSIRPGVIHVYEGGQISDRIFIAGGFAEVTTSRCTVLAEEAMPVGEIDRGKTEAQLKDLRDDLLDAKSDEEKAEIERRIAAAETKLQVAA